MASTAKRAAAAPDAADAKRARRAPLPVVIDTDPGVDDAMAILLALGRAGAEPVPLAAGGHAVPRRLEVLGLTVVHGNLGSAELEQLAANAARVLALAGRSDVPVYLGAERPLMLPRHEGAPHVHGTDGMGDVPPEEGAPEPRPPVRRETEDAAHFIARACRERPGEVTVVALGPLTNVALALALEPRLPQLARGLVCMGGAVAFPGNVSPLAEANVWNDPHAAQLAFNAGWDVTMVPLNVTSGFVLEEEYVCGTLRGLGGRVGRFLHAVTRFYVRFFQEVCRVDSMCVHDSSAVLALMCPELFTERSVGFVDVECAGEHTRGVVVGDLRQSTENAVKGREKRVTILLKMDTAAARRVLEDHYRSYGP